MTYYPSPLLDSDQSKAHQSRTRIKGNNEGGSFVCWLCYHSRCQRVDEGIGRKKGERNTDSRKKCVNRRISLLAGLLCTVRQSVCCRCWAPSVPAALAQHHWHFPITMSARLGAVSFPTHVLTDRIENARNVPNSLQAHRNACTSSVAQVLVVKSWLLVGNKNLRSVVEVLASPHTRSLPGQPAPCSHIFSSTQQEWTPDWVATGGKASQHAANPSHSSSRLSATIGLSDWSEVFYLVNDKALTDRKFGKSPAFNCRNTMRG